jgi:hypothetical protein
VLSIVTFAEGAAVWAERLGGVVPMRRKNPAPRSVRLVSPRGSFLVRMSMLRRIAGVSSNVRSLHKTPATLQLSCPGRIIDMDRQGTTATGSGGGRDLSKCPQSHPTVT